MFSLYGMIKNEMLNKGTLPARIKRTMIPEEYEQLEYIERKSSGKSYYLDLAYNPNNLTTLDISFMHTDKNYSVVGDDFCVFAGATERLYYDNVTLAENSIMCNITSKNSNRFINMLYNKEGSLKKSKTIYSSLNVKYRMLFGQKGLNLDENAVEFYRENRGSFKCSKSFYLFIANCGTTYAQCMYDFIGRIYHCKLGEGQNLVRDCLPVKRKSDGRYGMYCLISKKFYPVSNNAGFTGKAI